MKNKKPILIFDGNNLAHRVLVIGGLETKEGLQTAVIFGFLNSLISVLKKFNTNRFIIVWDSKQSIKRKKIYPEYKANRNKERDEETEEMFRLFYKQMDFLRKLFKFLGVVSIRIDGMEADDIMSVLAGTLGKKFNTIIVSTDRDMLQCVDKHTDVFNAIKKKLFTLDSFEKDIGLPPDQYSFARAIVGDKGDNIEGIKGIGDKTAFKMVAAGRATSVQELFKVLKGDKAFKGKKTTESVLLGKDIIQRNLELMVLPKRISLLSKEELSLFRKSVNNTFLKSIFICTEVSRKKLTTIMKKLEMNRFLENLEQNCRQLNVKLKGK